MKLYMVGMQGIQCYYPICILNNFEDAKTCAELQYKAEKDHYHTVQVHEWELDKLAPLEHEPIFEIKGRHGA